MGEEEINRFLSHLATHDNVAASTQNQALNALVFLYKHVMFLPPGSRVSAPASPAASAPRKTSQHRAEIPPASFFHVRIMRSGRNKTMPEKLLYLTDIMPRLKHMGSKRMPQRMRCYALCDPGTIRRTGQGTGNLIAMHTSALHTVAGTVDFQARIGKQRVIAPAQPRIMNEVLIKKRSNTSLVLLEKPHQFPVQNSYTIPVALASSNTNHKIIHIHVANAQSEAFRDTQGNVSTIRGRLVAFSANNGASV